MSSGKVRMITDLSKEDRKHIQEKIEKLLVSLNNCAGYLKDYAAGRQNAFKLFGVMCYMEEALVKHRDELAKLHPTVLPPKYRRSDD